MNPQTKLTSLGANRLSSMHCNFPSRQSRYGCGIKRAFRLLNPFVKSRWSIAGQYRNHLLGQYRSGINSLIDQVHGDSGDLDPIIERLLPGFEAGKRW